MLLHLAMHTSSRTPCSIASSSCLQCFCCSEKCICFGCRSSCYCCSFIHCHDASFTRLCPSLHADTQVKISPFWIFVLSIPGLPVSSATLVSPLDASSCNAFIGGGCSWIAWATIQPFIVSRPSTLGHDRSFLSYVAYVKKMDVEAYPDDQFVHANVPPLVVSQLLSLTVAKSICGIPWHCDKLTLHCCSAKIVCRATWMCQLPIVSHRLFSGEWPSDPATK